jgi:hypothetical protein
MRPAKPVKSIQWIDLSIERRELRRAAGRSFGQKSSAGKSRTLRAPKPLYDGMLRKSLDFRHF